MATLQSEQLVERGIGQLVNRFGSRFARAVGQTLLYTLVIFVGLLFLFPWLWLISTSLKPPAQMVEIPPKWIRTRSCG